MSHVKNTILFSISILLSFAAVTAQQPAPTPVPAASSAWVNVAPANVGFTVLMPSKASETVTPVEGHPGVETHVLALETELAGYVVAYTEFAKDISDPVAIKLLLDRAREGGVGQGQLKSEREIKLNAYFGREWTVEIPGGMFVTARAYWVKRRLYQTVFVTAPKANDLPEVIKLRQELATKFLDSFTLSSEAGK
jgi:hypothetical protein